MSRLAEALSHYLGRFRAPRTSANLAADRDVLVVTRPDEGRPSPPERAPGQTRSGTYSSWLRGILGSIEGPNPWNEEWPRLRSMPLCRAVVRGGSHLGKTFLLQTLAWRLAHYRPTIRMDRLTTATEQAAVPLLVRLSDLVVSGVPVLTERQVRQGLEQALRRQLVPADLAHHLAGNAHQSWFWLLIDTAGAPDDPEDLERVLQAIRGWNCRVLAALGGLVTDRWSVVTAEFWLAPLSPARVGCFLDEWSSTSFARRQHPQRLAGEAAAAGVSVVPGQSLLAGPSLCRPGTAVDP